jgi:microcystin-dependent protein
MTQVSAYFGPSTSLVNMHPNAIQNSTGGGPPHSNLMPFLVINFIIALSGVYPSRT